MTRYLMGGLIMIALIFLYLAWSEDPSWAPYMIIPLVLAAVVYVLAPQIDWWNYKRKPPMVPPPFLQILRKKSSFYNRLSPAGKKHLGDRMMLYTKAHDFKGQAMKSVPEDVKLVLGYYAALVTFNREDFLLEPFERIVLYPHPFPSPEIQVLHTSEMHVADGVLLFSMPHLMKGFAEPGKFFQPALYEFARVVRHLQPDLDWPVFEASRAGLLEAVSGFPNDRLYKVIGVPEPEQWAIAAHHFFQFPGRFKQVFPDLYDQMARCFGLDPLEPALINSISRQTV